ncbi:uncharacterized protein LOC134222030 [Armigeres subalbatus]|uniref:uncharacterized protein LOC134222030 n=1 Tax=Armigeres subalbatus TaxID=124917 RepID=UPI002ED30737
MAHKLNANLEGVEPNDSASACPECNRPDWADDMVQCEECEEWYHFSCAGVNRSVEHRTWTCNECSPISISSRSSRASSSKVLEIQRLREEQEIRRKRFLQEKALEKKRIEQEHQQILDEEMLERTFLKEKFALLEMHESSERGSIASNRSHKSNRESILQWMMDDGTREPTGSTPIGTATQVPNLETIQRRIGHEVRNRVSSFTEGNPAEPPPQPVASSSHILPAKEIKHRSNKQSIVANTGPVPKPRVAAPQPQPRIRRSVHQIPPAPPVSAVTDDASIDIPPLPFEYTPSESSDVGVFRNHRSGARVKRVAPPLQNTHLPTLADEVTFQIPRNVRHIETARAGVNTRDDISVSQGPTTTQIAARRVMSRDLPDFDGNPEDWPIFISQYDITTENCGFSNAENLIRLQRCLRGKARESVRSRLLLPVSVPQVIETLRMLYGRPGLLVTSLLNRVRATPAPRMERLETVIEFGMELQGLCDHLQAAGETAHMNNPALLQELEDKLPSQMRLQWAMHKQTMQDVTLQTFASYMSIVVKAASQVTKIVDCSIDRRVTEQRKKGKQNYQLLAHASQSLPNRSNGKNNDDSTTARKCPVCNTADHRVKECKQFLDLNVEGRWKCIHNLKLCRTCLNQHGKNRCRLSTKCGIDGCEFKHHSLLHSKVENKARTITVENHSHRDQDSKTLFRVIPVTLTGRAGTVHTYAFLDDGSDLTLVDKSIAQQLGESGPSRTLYLNWTSNVTRCEVDSEEVSFKISGVNGRKSFQIHSARTVSELKLPVQSLDAERMSQKYAHLKDLPLRGYENAVPRLLIGLDQLNIALPLKCREGRNGDPVATKTRLGWCVYGGTNTSRTVGISCHILELRQRNDLHEVIKPEFQSGRLRS